HLQFFKQHDPPMNKYFLLTFLFIVSIFSIQAQETITCNQGMIVVSEETCVSDSLRFTVTVSGDFDGCTAIVSGFPAGSVITRGTDEPVSISGPLETVFIFGGSLNQFVIPGCGEVTIRFDYSGDVCDPCGFTDVTLGGIPAIPTLGQWGLISLSLLFFIFGLVKMRMG